MGSDGEPTGELNSPSAMGLATNVYSALFGLLGKAETIQALGTFANNAGCTMVTDMANQSFVSSDVVTSGHETVNADDYPVRVGLYPEPTLPGVTLTPDTVRMRFCRFSRQPTRTSCITSASSSCWTARSRISPPI